MLRPVRPEDEEALHRQWNDPDVRRYLFDDAAVPLVAVRRRIADSASSFARDGFGLFTLAGREPPQEIVGFAGLRRFGPAGEVEILYALLPGSWGRGLATEAARAVLRFGLEDAGVEEILAGADLENVASFRVMERLGMTFARDVTIDGRPTRYYWIRKGELS